jgi:hypothetical protein
MATAQELAELLTALRRLAQVVEGLKAKAEEAEQPSGGAPYPPGRLTRQR